MGKYTKLENFLSSENKDSITLKFQDLEKITNEKLPTLAYTNSDWWSNPDNAHNEVWKKAGYKAEIIFENKEVKFKRLENHEVVKKQKSYAENVADFNQRWNITISRDPNYLEKFKNRFITVLVKYITQIELDVNTMRDFCFYNGFYYKKPNDPTIALLGMFIESGSQLFSIFNQIHNVSSYAFKIQSLFWSLFSNDKQKIAKSLYEEFINVIALSPLIGIFASLSHEGVIIYPAGAKILDEKIINKDIQWLADYPKVYELFEKSLTDFLKYSGENAEARSILDNLRASFEQLLKTIFNNDKTLENNTKDIKNWLRTKGIHPNIINSAGIFIHMKSYITFMNDVKHLNQEINYSKNEIEHMIYQTGIFIRLIIETEKNK